MKTTSVALFIICLISQFYPLFGQPIKTNEEEIVYKGNKFILAQQNTKDTLTITDPISGETMTKIKDTPPFPVSINGKHIHDINEKNLSMQYFTSNLPVEEKILSNLKGTFHAESLNDGILLLDIKQIIIDEKGTIVYSDYYDIQYVGSDKARRLVAYPHPDALFEKIENLPIAMYKGNKVAYRKRIFLNRYLVEIKNHTLTYRKL